MTSSARLLHHRPATPVAARKSFPNRHRPPRAARPVYAAARPAPSRAPLRPAARTAPAAPRLAPFAMKRGFKARWARFLQAIWRSREAVAAWFEVTFQTACNWWDELHAPSGDKVALAALEYPEAFARIVGVAE